MYIGGDRMLKSVIQWLAASETGRNNIIYFAYGDEELSSELEDIVTRLLEFEANVGELYTAIVEYRIELRRSKKTASELDLFTWIRRWFDHARGLAPSTQPVQENENDETNISITEEIKVVENNEINVEPSNIEIVEQVKPAELENNEVTQNHVEEKQDAVMQEQ